MPKLFMIRATYGAVILAVEAKDTATAVAIAAEVLTGDGRDHHAVRSITVNDRGIVAEEIKYDADQLAAMERWMQENQ